MIAKKCVGFLQRTADYHLRVQTHSDEIVVWTDASFAPEGSRSHSGWMVVVGEAPVSWRSSRQSTVTLSSAESELAASVEGALALVSREALLSELNVGQWRSVLKRDSTSAASIQRGSGSWRTRHLRIKSSWIGERLEAGDLSIEHCPGEIQIADALTKALSSQRLRDLSRCMGLMSLDEVIADATAASSSRRSSRAQAPNPSGLRILVALIVLSQAVHSYDAAVLD